MDLNMDLNLSMDFWSTCPQRFATPIDTLYISCGNIFNYEGYGFDGIVLLNDFPDGKITEGFFNGMTIVKTITNRQIENINSISSNESFHPSLLRIYDPINVYHREGLYAVSRGFRGVYYFSEIRPLIYKSFDELVARGCKNIGFHGVGTSSPDVENEEKTIVCIVKWLMENQGKFESITLVDANNSYCKYGNLLINLINP